MRTGTGLIVIAAAVGLPALVVATSCGAWFPGEVCGPGGYVGLSLVGLAVAALLLTFGLLALTAPKPRDPFGQELHCPQCGRILEPHPDLDRWYCRSCDRYFRSHTETALFQRREVPP